VSDNITLGTAAMCDHGLEIINQANSRQYMWGLSLNDPSEVSGPRYVQMATTPSADDWDEHLNRPAFPLHVHLLLLLGTNQEGVAVRHLAWMERCCGLSNIDKYAAYCILFEWYLQQDRLFAWNDISESTLPSTGFGTSRHQINFLGTFGSFGIAAFVHSLFMLARQIEQSHRVTAAEKDYVRYHCHRVASNLAEKLSLHICVVGRTQEDLLSFAAACCCRNANERQWAETFAAKRPPIPALSEGSGEPRISVLCLRAKEMDALVTQTVLVRGADHGVTAVSPDALNLQSPEEPGLVNATPFAKPARAAHLSIASNESLEESASSISSCVLAFASIPGVERVASPALSVSADAPAADLCDDSDDDIFVDAMETVLDAQQTPVDLQSTGAGIDESAGTKFDGARLIVAPPSIEGDQAHRHPQGVGAAAMVPESAVASVDSGSPDLTTCDPFPRQNEAGRGLKRPVDPAPDGISAIDSPTIHRAESPARNDSGEGPDIVAGGQSFVDQVAEVDLSSQVDAGYRGDESQGHSEGETDDEVNRMTNADAERPKGLSSQDCDNASLSDVQADDEHTTTQEEDGGAELSVDDRVNHVIADGELLRSPNSGMVEELVGASGGGEGEAVHGNNHSLSDMDAADEKTATQDDDGGAELSEVDFANLYPEPCVSPNLQANNRDSRSVPGGSSGLHRPRLDHEPVARSVEEYSYLADEEMSQGEIQRPTRRSPQGDERYQADTEHTAGEEEELAGLGEGHDDNGGSSRGRQARPETPASPLMTSDLHKQDSQLSTQHEPQRDERYQARALPSAEREELGGLPTGCEAYDGSSPGRQAQLAETSNVSPRENEPIGDAGRRELESEALGGGSLSMVEEIGSGIAFAPLNRSPQVDRVQAIAASDLQGSFIARPGDLGRSVLSDNNGIPQYRNVESVEAAYLADGEMSQEETNHRPKRTSLEDERYQADGEHTAEEDDLQELNDEHDERFEASKRGRVREPFTADSRVQDDTGELSWKDSNQAIEQQKSLNVSSADEYLADEEMSQDDTKNTKQPPSRSAPENDEVRGAGGDHPFGSAQSPSRELASAEIMSLKVSDSNQRIVGSPVNTGAAVFEPEWLIDDVQERNALADHAAIDQEQAHESKIPGGNDQDAARPLPRINKSSELPSPGDDSPPAGDGTDDLSQACRINHLDEPKPAFDSSTFNASTGLEADDDSGQSMPVGDNPTAGAPQTPHSDNAHQNEIAASGFKFEVLIDVAGEERALGAPAIEQERKDLEIVITTGSDGRSSEEAAARERSGELPSAGDDSSPAGDGDEDLSRAYRAIHSNVQNAESASSTLDASNSLEADDDMRQSMLVGGDRTDGVAEASRPDDGSLDEISRQETVRRSRPLQNEPFLLASAASNESPALEPDPSINAVESPSHAVGHAAPAAKGRSRMVQRIVDPLPTIDEHSQLSSDEEPVALDAPFSVGDISANLRSQQRALESQQNETGGDDEDSLGSASRDGRYSSNRVNSDQNVVGFQASVVGTTAARNASGSTKTPLRERPPRPPTRSSKGSDLESDSDPGGDVQPSGQARRKTARPVVSVSLLNADSSPLDSRHRAASDASSKQIESDLDEDRSKGGEVGETKRIRRNTSDTPVSGVTTRRSNASLRQVASKGEGDETAHGPSTRGRSRAESDASSKDIGSDISASIDGGELRTPARAGGGRIPDTRTPRPSARPSNAYSREDEDSLGSSSGDERDSSNRTEGGELKETKQIRQRNTTPVSGVTTRRSNASSRQVASKSKGDETTPGPSTRARSRTESDASSKGIGSDISASIDGGELRTPARAGGGRISETRTPRPSARPSNASSREDEDSLRNASRDGRDSSVQKTKQIRRRNASDAPVSGVTTRQSNASSRQVASKGEGDETAHGPSTRARSRAESDASSTGIGSDISASIDGGALQTPARGRGRISETRATRTPARLSNASGSQTRRASAASAGVATRSSAASSARSTRSKTAGSGR
jgi:hypothetical protein